MSPFEIVRALRAQFTGPLYPDHSAAFLIALCRRLHQEFPTAPRAGLRRKDGGTHTTLPDGTNVALDIVMYADGAAYDVLGDSDGAAAPAWNPIGDLPAEWYVPVDPGEPPPPPPPPVDLGPILRRLDALEAAIAALPPPADPGQWEAWGRVWGFGITLQLRRKQG